jgi:3-isopropylmalate dehydrogenase
MHLKILVTAGDGIGPEVTNEAVAVLKEVAAISGHTLEFDAKRIGGVAIVQDGTPLPAETLAAALSSDAVLLGAVGGNEFNSLAPDKRPEAGLLQIRAALGGFANLRPAFASRSLRSTARCVPRSSRAQTFSLSANCLAASTSASPANGTRPAAKPGTRCVTRAMK